MFSKYHCFGYVALVPVRNSYFNYHFHTNDFSGWMIVVVDFVL